MRTSFLGSLLALSYFLTQAAMATDIAPDPELHGGPLAGLAVAGTFLTLTFVSLGLWLRKRAADRKESSSSGSA